jgi:hypothetical protein
MLASLLALAAALQPFVQVEKPLPEGIAATWTGGRLTEAAYARWLSVSLGSQHEEVQSALEHLLQIRLVEVEAAQRGLTVRNEDVEARFNEASAALKAEGLDLARELKSRGMSEAEFRKLLSDSLLHERLARADLAIPEGTEIRPAQLQAWTRERIAAVLAAHVKTEGMSLFSGPYRIPHEEVGATLLRTMSPGKLRDFAGQCALESALPAWGAAQGLVLDDAVLVAEVEWRRRRVAENPNYKGATYEDLLAARGSSVEAVLASGELRVAGWLRLYADRQWQDSWFDNLSADERRSLEDEFGPARDVSWLLLHAKVEKESELDLDLAGAAEELRAWKAQMKSPADFATLAERYSEHEESRRRGGRFGVVHLLEPGVDPLLCAAAFMAPVGEISEPVPVTGGLALLLVHAERPTPAEPDFRRIVRRARQEEARAQFLKDLELKTRWDER